MELLLYEEQMRKLGLVSLEKTSGVPNHRCLVSKRRL